MHKKFYLAVAKADLRTINFKSPMELLICMPAMVSRYVASLNTPRPPPQGFSQTHWNISFKFS